MTEEMKMDQEANVEGNVEENVEETAEETVEEAVVEESGQLESDTEMLDMTSLKKGDSIKGKIVKIDEDQVFVSVGYKYDGIIPLKELSSLNLDSAAEAVELGQEVELKVLSINDEKETMILSKRVIDGENAWEQLQQQLESGEIIEATVAEVVKGGLVVDLGIRGFIPASMVERHFVEDFSEYKGKVVRLKVKELDREKNKLILSQKDVLDEEYEENKKEILNQLELGQVLEGTVQRLTPFGTFVDIGGIDGLVHISEMAWHHVDHPSEVVSVGDAVKVKVLKVSPDSERISLSIKAVQEGPWDTVAQQFSEGTITTGIVKRLVTFGAFVEITPGVEGLVHISQIAHRHIGTPHEVLEEGQEVSVKILELNPAEKRVSLSIKETEEAPEQAPRSPRNDRPSNKNEDYELPANQSLNLTLGERFGDRLKNFK